MCLCAWLIGSSVAGAEKDRKEREERSAKREREVEERNFREIQRAIEEEG